MIFLMVGAVVDTQAEPEKKPVEVPAGEIGKEAPKDKEETKTEPVKEESEKQEAEKVVPVDPDDEAAAENQDAEQAAKAVPVSPDAVQVFGWREKIMIDGLEKTLNAKLDTGALTNSIHAEEKEMFERDGKKWVRFIATDPRSKKSPRVRLEAPLVRVARIKEPGGESQPREVVRLSFKIGDKKLRGDFTLNNRANMLSPVLLGRTTVRELGWVDSSRTNLAEQKIMR